MPSVIEEIPEVIRTALILMPELANVPVLGRIAVLLAGTHQLDDTHPLEQFDKAREADKAVRERERDENSRYVIKVSEALKCVDKGLFDSKLLLAFLKGLINILLGKSQSADALMYDQIKQCILENRLRQDTPRVFSTTGRYHRPSRGHGKGRTSFG
jgi:hypothetical protein